MKILGLDEAGRGCVLGPLIVGAYCCEADNLAALAATGATDSKALSAKKREAILKLLPDHGTARILSISPAQIDAANINTLEEEAFIAHIRHFKPDVVYLDAPVHPRGIPKLQARMTATLAADGLSPDWVIEPKADANYPVVGAASIAAKVHRDAQIHALGPVGSGYPSDPVTRKWLLGFIQENAPLPDCVRKRWGTIEKLRQQSLFG
ncbi:MAG: ribonuclease HII [Myxococcota bacterium]|jgi:ribonuclease HII